jgi:hypothetical protein
MFSVGLYVLSDRLCGIVVGVSGYRSRGPVFDFWRYQIFCEVVGPERDQLSPVTATEVRLDIKYIGSGLESREYYLGDPMR